MYFSNGNIKIKAFYSNDKIKEKCYGILYNENGEEMYKGSLLNGIPKEGKSLIEYSDNDGVLYNGDFKSFKYNGKGILYYNDEYIITSKIRIKFDGIFKDNYYSNGILYCKNGYKEYEGEFKENKYEGVGVLYFKRHNIKYYEGSFTKGIFKYGILYGLKNEILYKGEFKNNIPKKGENIKLYTLDGYLEYEGNISNCLYEGMGKIIYGDNNEMIFKGIFEKGNKKYGIIYDNKRKIYEGEFEDDKFNGYGKIYALDNYNNNYLFYEGNFKDSSIYGKGIKYYINGKKKIEGHFINILLFNGIYYNINNQQIFKGEVTPQMINTKNIILYNDNGGNIYNDETIKIYKDYFNREFREINIILLSKGFPGKTSILNRLIDDKFNEQSLGTIGIDYKSLRYECQTDLYKLKIYDTSGGERYRSILNSYFREFDIFIIVFDLSEENTIDKNRIYELNDSFVSKEKLIYFKF